MTKGAGITASTQLGQPELTIRWINRIMRTVTPTMNAPADSFRPTPARPTI